MSKNERLVVLGLLVAVLATLFVFPLTNPKLAREPGAVLFASLFLLSFTVLLLEHFFSRPTDVIAAGVSILLLVIPSRPLLEPWGNWYWAFLGYEVLAVVLATSALLLLTEAEGAGSRRNRAYTFRLGQTLSS